MSKKPTVLMILKKQIDENKTAEGISKAIYQFLVEQNIAEKVNCKKVCEECRLGQRGCVACKKELINNINKELTPIREKRKYYEEHPEEVDKILFEGTTKAREEAKKQMKKIKKAMKLDHFEE